MDLEDLQHSLEAHECRINEPKRIQELALKARTRYKERSKKDGQKNSRKLEANKTKWKSIGESREGNRKENSFGNDEKEWKFDKRKVQCCQRDTLPANAVTVE